MTGYSSGRVLVFASAPQCVAPLDVIQTMDIVQGLFQSYGRLFAFVRRSAFPNGSFKAVAEFCNVSAVVGAVSSFNNFVTPEASLSHSRSPLSPLTVTAFRQGHTSRRFVAHA